MQEQERRQRKAEDDAHEKFMKAEAKRIAADNAAEQRNRAAQAAEDRKRKADSQVYTYISYGACISCIRCKSNEGSLRCCCCAQQIVCLAHPVHGLGCDTYVSNSC